MSNYAPVRGLDPKQELSPENLLRDTRPTGTRIVDSLLSTNVAVLVLIGHALATWVFPAVGAFALISALLLTWWALTRKESAPIKMPIQCGLMDSNEPHPAHGGPSKAEGIFHLGTVMQMGSVDRGTGKEVWLTNSDCRQHFLVVGTTGSGKTEMLLGFCANALTWGSGFLYCDGKGDVSLFAKIYALARRFGREDDVLVINLMTSNTDVTANGGRILSNTLNPFTSGSSDSLTQMVVSLMDEVGGDGAMWKGRAVALFTGVMRALVWKREAGLIDLNIGIISDHLNLNKIIELAAKENEPDMPVQIRASIEAYLNSLPGFQKEKGPKQSQTTLDQHGFLQMQFTKILGNLADVYGHIFLTPHGEVDMTDVVLNRRILIVMLPALEKSADEVANLGKIIVATLKGMMGATLGSKIEASYDEVVLRRPYNSPSPFIVILDEVGYYCVTGMAIMAAQGRSLGFSLVFATQDIPAMLRENDKEAKSIIANTSTKIFMRVEENEMTGKLAVDSAGEGYKAHVGGYTGKAGEMNTSYADNMEARVERVTRINPTDLRALNPGQAFVTWHDKYFKIKTFYTNPEAEYDDLKNLELRANHFIPVARPNPVDVVKQNLLPEIAERLCDPGHAKRMEEAARKARAQVEKLAAEKRDPLKIPGEILCGAVAYLRAKGNLGNSKLNNAALQAGLMTAACSSIAAVLLASKEQGEAFSNKVRAVEGLPAKSGAVARDGMARSGQARAPSQVPGLVRPDRAPPAVVRDRGPAGEAPMGRPDPRAEARGAPQGRAPVRPTHEAPPPFSHDDEIDFDGAADEFVNARSAAPNVAAFGMPDFSDAQKAAARSDAPSTMRAVEHGITVDTDVFKMAEKIQTNDSTLRMLASLDFEDEPGEEVVSNNIEIAISMNDDELAPVAPPPASNTPDAGEIERADVASAKATQWTDRGKPARSAAENDAQLEDAVRSGDHNAVTSAFLADLLGED